MPRIIILCDEYPRDMTHGLYLRVRHLCEQLALQNECFLICSSISCEQPESLADSPFVDMRLVPRGTREHRSPARHVRMSNARFLEQNSPAFYREICNEVREVAVKWKPDLLISFALPLAEVGISVDLPRILDLPDCATLTIETILNNPTRQIAMTDRLILNLQRYRQLRRERALLNEYDAITTISAPDRRRMLEVSGVSSSHITVVPNGVAEVFFRQRADTEKIPRSIVFWGNLDFSPNWTAIKYFYKEIFVPFLASENVNWYIVGRGANRSLEKIGEHPNIHLTGFQQDLAQFVGDKCLMINPMVEGSGLKNKVIESFALGLPVVTTSLGVAAIEGQADEHYLVADQPRQFAASILRLLQDVKTYEHLTSRARELVSAKYAWPAVAQKFQRVISSVRGCPLAMTET